MCRGDWSFLSNLHIWYYYFGSSLDLTRLGLHAYYTVSYLPLTPSPTPSNPSVKTYDLMPIRRLAAICIHFAQQYSVAWFPLIHFLVGSRVIHNGAIGELAEQSQSEVLCPIFWTQLSQEWHKWSVGFLKNYQIKKMVQMFSRNLKCSIAKCHNSTTHLGYENKISHLQNFCIALNSPPAPL